jgi:hypothetical protein
MFCGIGELVRHYESLPYHIAKDGTQYMLVSIFKVRDTHRERQRETERERERDVP